MTEIIKQWIDKQCLVERIYEPKYGGKDHSGYDTMMKYEVNFERMEAYDNGLTKGIEIAQGFQDWILKEFDNGNIGIGHESYDWQGKIITTSQLLEKYIQSLDKPQS